MCITPDMSAMSSAINTIPTVVYWNIRGIITCATQIAHLTSMGHDYKVIWDFWYEISSTEMQSWELSSLTSKIDHMHEFLRRQLENCNHIVEEKKEIEFRRSFNQLFETGHMDNMKILKILISPKDDIQPLFDFNTKIKVSLEVLRRRNVLLLLISWLDMSCEELSILEEIYNESCIHGSRTNALYEVVWIPIVDPSVNYTKEMDRKFEEMNEKMSWYSVSHPSIIDKVVMKCIGDRWHFRKSPILMGKELSPIMQQIKKLLSYDKDGSWALLCRGSKILTNGHGTTMMQTPSDFDMWKKDIETNGFDFLFMEYHDKLHVAANNCCRFEFPIAASRVPDGMRCPECHRFMEKYIAFLCFHDQDGLLELD
uniref:Sieve element occlusion C-terminal domain-containing protein n=1 Tax=Lactuca sativa TaxID=4236 RepID=A0A9R1VG49_LACSA|nr:hypothetical protein LSAT_V11C500290740 [Lactuca sativa]